MGLLAIGDRRRPEGVRAETHGDRRVAGRPIVTAGVDLDRLEEWRADLARRHGVEAALTDSATIELVRSVMNTGKEYEKTSDRYEHGIRSTPTMIINNRMIIGTLPMEQLRAIFQALVAEAEGDSRFMENWVQRGP